MTFFSRLEDRARQVDSLLCVGLDPHLPDLPAPTAEAARDFCLRLIESTAEFAVAFKPNSAFFEAFGPRGMDVLIDVIATVPPAIPVILDAKRGDIASTAEAYARAVFQTLGAAAVTASPYLGRDSVEPFLADPERGVFLLCKTSNPGAADLQDVEVRLAGRDVPAGHLYEHVALLAQSWNANGNVGLVVGSTQPEALRRLRLLVPDLWFLAPGVGAQGADLHAALQTGLRPDGLGMLIPVSRLLSRAADPRRAAKDLRDQINCERTDAKSCVSTVDANIVPPGRGTIYRAPTSLADGAGRGPAPTSLPDGTGSVGAGSEPALTGPAPTGPTSVEPASYPLSPPSSPLTPNSLADGLLSAGCVKFGQFTLKSGLESPIYLDLRQLVSYPSLLGDVAMAYTALLRTLAFDRLAAIPYAALPIGAAISLQTGWPLVYPRKEAKAYGTKAEIEGLYAAGERVAVVDDLATTGGSKLEAIQKLTAAGLIVSDVVVLIDRQSGAAESLAQAGYQLHAVFSLAQLLDYWEAAGKVPADQIAAARAFLASAQAST